MSSSNAVHSPGNMFPGEESRGRTTKLGFPDFIEKKLQACEENTFKPRKNGKPLLIGNREPDSSSIVLQSNDYLNISKHPEITRIQIEVLERTGKDLVMSAVFHA